MSHRTFLVAATLSLAACADLEPDVATTEQSIITYSLTTAKPAASAPPLSQWNGSLPGDVSANQVWLFTPLDQGNVYLLQVDPVGRKVTYRTVLTANLVPGAIMAAAQRPGTQVSIRNPPPPPPDPWDPSPAAADLTARFGVNLGRHADYLPLVPWWK